MFIRKLFAQKHRENSRFFIPSSVPLHDRLHDSGLFESEDDVNNNFEQLVGYFRGWLEEHQLERETALLDYMLEKKQGMLRKDGKAPSAIHEVSQALYFISCIEDGLYHSDPAGVLATILVHDLQEDFKVKRDDMRAQLIQNGIADDKRMQEFLDDYDTISYHNGDKDQLNYPNKHQYSLSLRKRRNTGPAKLIDNVHNSATAVGGLQNAKLLKYKDKIINGISLFAETITTAPKDRAEISELMIECLKGAEHTKVNTYTGKIQLQISSYVEDASSYFPENTELLKTLEKVLGKTIQINRHLFYNDYGQSLDLSQHDFPDKGFKLPRGLHPYHVARDRVLSMRPELAPADYQAARPSLKFSDDNGTQPV